jgi:hypothetical protein
VYDRLRRCYRERDRFTLEIKSTLEMIPLRVTMA